MRGVSGGDPADGARSGVPRRRLATARRWGSAPALRHYTAGVRGVRWTDPDVQSGEGKGPPGPKSPRWSAERRASPERRGRLTRALGAPRGTLRGNEETCAV